MIPSIAIHNTLRPIAPSHPRVPHPTKPNYAKHTARYLGYRRTGSSITKALKSAINGGIRRGLLEYEGDKIRRRTAT